MKTRWETLISVGGCSLLLSVDSGFAQNWTNISLIGGENNILAASADGSKLVAGTAFGGLIHTSTNAGATWIPNNVPVSEWPLVLSSATGTNLVSLNHKSIWTSTNAGSAWFSNNAPLLQWASVASSAPGNKLVGAGSLQVHTSTDSGITWRSNNVPAAYWSSVASSADGQRLLAFIFQGPIYISNDSGTTWISNNAPGLGWSHVASSAAGNKLVALDRGVNYTSIYTSADGGASWFSNNLPLLDWISVASSAEGNKLVAAASSGEIYTSSNSGALWVSNGVPRLRWTSVASSADGNAMWAVDYNSQVYLSRFTPRPALNITSAGSSALISWLIPSQPFVLQENPTLDPASWTDLPNPPVLNFTNLNHEVFLPVPDTPRFYRLRTRPVNLAGTFPTANLALSRFGGQVVHECLNSSAVVSAGTPMRPNWIVRYNTVQEQSGGPWATSTPGTSISKLSSSPTVNATFTSWSVPGGTGYHFYDGAGCLTGKTNAFSDCRFSGGRLQCYRGSPVFLTIPVHAAFTNCLWQRVILQLENQQGAANWALFNNLFYGGTFAYDAEGSSPPPLVFDNLFDQTTITKEGGVNCNHGTNGYVGLSGAHLQGTSTGGDKDITAPADYQPSLMGNFYYPTTGTKLVNLIDWGSRTASAAGLSGYTVRTDQTADLLAVDIGYHSLSIAAPTALTDTQQTCRNTPVNFPLQGSDLNNFTLSYIIVANPAHGTLSVCGQNVTYTPNAGFCGADTFTFKVNNGFLDSATAATVTVQVGDPNPVAVCQDVMVKKGVATTFTLTGTGNACNETLTFQIVPGSGPNHGQLTVPTPLDANHAQVTYTPNSGYEGSDKFTFTVSDCGFVSAPAPDNVTINVVPGPTLTTECRYSRILLTWTLPPFLQTLAASGYIQDFQIFRCSGVNCTPSTTPIAVISDPLITSDPLKWRFFDPVTPGQTFCYAITFRHKNGCDNVTVFESPRSNTSCNQTCPLPPPDPIDVAFIIDNTGSMGQETLNTLRAEIADVLEDIEGTSGGDYRLAMVTPDEDQVDVRLTFTTANRNAFESVLAGNISVVGGNFPESTDECLNTIVNALIASGRINTESCTKSPLQIGDFTPAFRTNARKFAVLITDDVPGGFCDDFDPLVDPPRAHQFALQAKSQCIRINAIQIALLNGTFVSDAKTVMQDYAQTSCGWFSQLPHVGTGIGQAIRNMLHTAGACSCP